MQRCMCSTCWCVCWEFCVIVWLILYACFTLRWVLIWGWTTAYILWISVTVFGSYSGLQYVMVCDPFQRVCPSSMWPLITVKSSPHRHFYSMKFLLYVVKNTECTKYQRNSVVNPDENHYIVLISFIAMCINEMVKIAQCINSLKTIVFPQFWI